MGRTLWAKSFEISPSEIKEEWGTSEVIAADAALAALQNHHEQYDDRNQEQRDQDAADDQDRL